MFFKICGAHKNCANFTGKQLRWSLFLIKLQAFRLQTSIKTVKDDVFVIQYFHFYYKSYWRKWRMMRLYFLSRLRKSVVSWWYIFPLLSCFDSPWSDNACKSAKRDLFPQSEGNFWANVMSNQWHNPFNVSASGSIVFSINS